METHTIDATGKKLGRIASDASRYLMGKHSAHYVPNKVADIKVSITNVASLDLNDKKMSQTIYTFYSGYPGGLTHTSMKKIIDSKGYTEVMRKAIYGMLPNNKLRALRMKRLDIS